MNNSKAQKWLKERGIELEESFVKSLRNLAETYKKENNIKRIEDVYNIIGIKKQYISHWEINSSSTQTKNFQAKYHQTCC